MKLIYLVLDGASDGFIEKTALEAANKPALDSLTPESRLGLMYPIRKGIAPESDAAVLSLLGYDPHKYYTGRGPLEALGAGVRIKEGFEVAFRANFATVNPVDLSIIDRRCGRDLTSEEGRELASVLDGMKLPIHEGYVRFRATIGHRAVVVIGSTKHRLSGNVSNTDPAYVKRGVISVAVRDYEMRIPLCRPLDSSEEAKRAADLVNEFTRKVIEILDKHPINIKRAKEGRLKANAVLLRDSGDTLPKVKPIKEVFGRSFSAVVEMPVEKGIALLLDMKVAQVPPPTKDKAKDYEERLAATLKLLRETDVVYVHLKGPDEPGHDGDFKRKVKAIELIDKYFVSPLLDKINLDDTALIVTSDHCTPWTLKSHSSDPVPVMVKIPGMNGDGLKNFTEKNCEKGSLGLIEHGWLLLPKVFNLMKSR
ncbi:MAG: 2,3-bisphosphoglycerate-independent phosphoglycerate mutase [Thermoproteales archaeon]|nr:2,3-bisphosphoglycerate-independent phosphoglycerate mutase [Thermoproteales archaeon]